MYNWDSQKVSLVLRQLAHKRKLLDKDDIILFYTGLKDKNKKEIYEGNILRTECNIISSPEGVGTVIFRCGAFIIDWGVKDHWSGFYHFLKRRETIEVIGSIYENKELLKG